MSCIPVRVALRCRPFVSQEKCDGCQPCLQFIPNESQVVLGSKKHFTFDYTFSEDVGQAKVFNSCVMPMIDNVFKGYNVTVMAYGQTGSGKTYTMGTVFSPTISNDADKIGIIPRAIKEIFEGINTRSNSDFHLKASFLEVYKEDVIDLLRSSHSGGREEIAIRDDANGVKIVGIAEISVNTYDEVLHCLERGSLMRTTGTTAMNTHSSRSHAIFTLNIEIKNRETNENVHSKFHFVDLAGSERAKKTKAEGERFKEGVNINLGLLALGNVICALSEGSSRNHVPYRESKLTRLIQDSLGGSSHTIMIACIGPADYNMEETLNTLRYAHRARKIKNKPVVNQNPQAAEIARLRLLVQQLQGQTNNGNSEGNVQSVTGAEFEAAKERILQLEIENDNLNRELQNAIDQTTDLYEKAFMAEQARDKVKQKLEELRQKTGITLNSFNQSVDNDNSKFQEHFRQIQDLHETVANIQEVQEKLELSSGIANNSDPNLTFDVAGSNMTNETCNATTNDECGSKRRAEMNRQLQALNKALALKEELAVKLSHNSDQFGTIKEQYENNMKELEKEVAVLQQEKEDLSAALRAAQSNSNNKISEQRRKRMIELEAQLSELKRKMTEFQRMASMKATSDKEISKLNKEINDMKHTRVQLVRQMKQESERMRKYKLDKEREVNHLKQQEQKRRIELTKQQQRFEREQNVSKRRLEQAAAVNKRLKEALLRQKQHGEKRDNNKEKAGTERVRNFVDQELELVMSVAEAKYHLELLVEERRQLSEQIERLRNDYESTSESSSNESSIMSPSKKLSRINQLEMDMEMRQIQINEIQQKLLDADQEERKKIRWAGIQLMSEAKTGLKYLFDLVAANKQELVAVQNSNHDVVRQNEINSKAITTMKKEISNLKFSKDEEMVQLRKIYEDQIYLIMTAKQNEDTTKSAYASITSGTSSLVTASEEPPQMENFIKPVNKQMKDRSLTKMVYLDTDSEMSSDEDQSKKVDPDWTHTPFMRRIALMRAHSNSADAEKQNEPVRGRKAPLLDLNLSDTENQYEPMRGKKRKSDEKGCGCRSGCSQKRCKCFKKDKSCDEGCSCGSICTNRRKSETHKGILSGHLLIDS
ncbi:hypothetical protein CHUAL_012786 [Chamberlinius hualienensis]